MQNTGSAPFATPRVAVVVLSYNGCADTLCCLESLAAQTCPDLSVIVVDNASADGSAAAIRARFPAMRLIVLPENRGWAGGNNVGIVAALDRDAALICLLNNDTIVAPGTMEALAQAIVELPSCVLHPGIDYADPALGAQLDAGVKAEAQALPDHPGVFPMHYAYGACLMVPASLFREIGLFDERFFLQLEEADFYARARRLGVRALCLPGVRIVHAESRSFGGRTTPLKTYYIVRNQMLMAEKHTPGLAARVSALRAALWSVLKLRDASGRGGAILWLLSADPHARAARMGLIDYMLRRFGAASADRVRALAPR